MLKGLRRVDNESGVVLFIVLMVAIIIMIFSLGILTQSVNEMNYAQTQIDQMTCDQLKEGFLWKSYISQGMVPGTQTVTVDGRDYTIALATAATVNGITNWQVSCSYTTVQ